MRKIKIYTWKEQRRDMIGELIEEVDVDTCALIRKISQGLPPAQMPRGMVNFDIFQSLHISLGNADGKEHLYLEENIYEFVVKTILSFVPGHWAMMDDVREAVMAIRNAIQVDVSKLEEIQVAREEEKPE